MAKIGRPTNNPKVHQFRVRLNQEENALLSLTAEKLKCSKSDVIIEGIKLVNKKIENNE